MKKIHDPQAVASWLKTTRYGPMLAGLGVELFLAEYEKGELVTAPFQEETWFQMVVRGSLNIYFIRDDGERYSLSQGGREYLLGDMELFLPRTGNTYTEAAQQVVCLAISLDQNREKLLESAPFLRILCRSMAEKMAAITALDAAPCSLEDRVLTYMRYKCRDGVLKGLEREAFRLHCSARQLQRILNGLCARGLAQKLGKGTYRLTEERPGMKKE